MKRFLVPILAALACATVGVALQERVSKPKAKDFGGLLTEAKTAFDETRYGAAVDKLGDALAIAAAEQRKAVLAAFPPAPESWTFKADESADESAAQLAGLALMAGNNIAGEYSEKGGNGRMHVTVMANSPLARMFTMWVANPAMLGKDAELVKYGQHNAVLRTRTKGSSYEMQILVLDDVIQIDLNGASDDFLLKVWSQNAVDALAGALSK